MTVLKSPIVSAEQVIETEQKQFVSQQTVDNIDDLINNSENITGSVNTFADLPDVTTSVGQKWKVENATGVWGVNRKPAGVYLSTGTIWTSKFNAVDVINVLTSTHTQKALSAAQGKILKDTKVESVVAGSNISVDNSDPLNPVISSTASSADVTSVFGRVGAVTAQADDYLASQISNDSQVAGLRLDTALDNLETTVESKVDSVASGIGIDVDNTNPNQPVVSVNAAVLLESEVVDILTSTLTVSPLSANAGRVLNEDLQSHKGNTSNPHSTTFTQAVSEDSGTDITAAEAETLTDGSFSDSLHKHNVLTDEVTPNTVLSVLNNVLGYFIAGTRAFAVRSNRDLTFDNYSQNTRNNVTSNDEKVLTTDDSGNVVLRRVLPFYDYFSRNDPLLNEETALADYLVFTFDIPETGDYEYTWNVRWSSNDPSDDAIFELHLDDVLLPDQRFVIEPKDTAGTGITVPTTTGGNFSTGTNQRYPASFSDLIQNLSAGQHTLKLKFAGSVQFADIAVYNGNISIVRRR